MKKIKATKISRQAKVLLAFAVGLFFVILLTVEAYDSIQSDQQVLAGITRTGEIRATLGRLLVELDEAEIGQQGYLITGNATYLEPYQSSVASLNSTEASLGSLVEGDANLSSAYNRLQSSIDEELRGLKQSIDVQQSQGSVAAAKSMVVAGQSYMNQIRNTIAKMNAYSDLLENQQLGIADQERTGRVALTFVGSIIAVGSTTFAAYTIGRGVKKEVDARTQAELLQDILAHDIGNYNQVSRMNAELLSEQVKGDKELEELADDIIQGIDGSTELAGKARKLGRIVSEGRQRLEAVDLLQSIERALALTKKNYPAKVVEESKEIVRLAQQPAPAEIRVLADDLLDEVFLNIFSNAVKFTEQKTVPIGILIEELPAKSHKREWLAKHIWPGGVVAQIYPIDKTYWRVSISDNGSGISDAQKQSIFGRYTSSKTGTGLGMSIVHALVVGRYGGRISVGDNSYEDGPKIARPIMNGRGTVFVVELVKFQESMASADSP